MAAVIRDKRFEVNEESDLALLLETSQGDRIRVAIKNVSAKGLAGRFEAAEEAIIVADQLVPHAKLVWRNGAHEAPLGRLNPIRVTSVGNSSFEVAFTLIDSAMPLLGALSFELHIDPSDTKGERSLDLDPDRFSLADLAQVCPDDVDLMSRFKAASTYRRAWQKKPIYLYETYRNPSKGTRVKLQLNRKSQRSSYVIMGSNDYLGLASHPEVVEAAKKALDDYGFGSTGSPLTTGRTAVHEELRDYLARLFKKDAAILFNSGYAANVGAISCMIRPGDLVLADQLCHASIQDGLQMCKGTVRYFKHNDMTHLRRLLDEHRATHRACLLVTEGIFSMDGDLARFSEIADIATEYRARTFLDEAHSFGVVGDRGLGLWETLTDGQEADIIMGTFSKICGGIGGFVAGDQQVADWMHYFARSQVFSVSIPPCNAAAVLKALQIFVAQPELVTRLKDNISYFVQGMRQLGAPLVADHKSAIVPVTIGDEKKMGVMAGSLLDNGIYVIPIVFPAVSRSGCRFRFTVMATHTQSDLDLALSHFEQAMRLADFRFGENESEQPVVNNVKQLGRRVA